MSDKDFRDEEKFTTLSMGKLPEQGQSNSLTTVQALEQAQKLLGCYRHGDANDPIVYGTAVARILSKYSRDVVLFVCDPYTGLPGKSSFMPSIAEILAACEARAGYLAKIDRLKTRGRSLEPTNDQLPKELEKPRPTMDELHAKYGGPTWGIDQDVRKSTQSSNAMTLEQILEHYKTHHLNSAPKQSPAKSKSKRDRGKGTNRQR